MTETEIYLIAATVGSPFFAVFAQRTIEDYKQERQRKLQLFKLLYATAHSPTGEDFVNAFNLVRIEFRKDKDIVKYWEEYLAILTPSATPTTEAEHMESTLRRTDILYKLIGAISKKVGMDLDGLHLKNSLYAPQAWSNIQKLETSLKIGLNDWLSGNSRPKFEAHVVDHTTDDM